MVLNPFRCKQYWVSSILDRNTLLAKIQTNKKKLTLFSEGCWYPHRKLQSCIFLIYRRIFLYVFGLTFEFSSLLTEGDSSPTLSGTYTSGRTLFKVSCFDFWDATGQAYVQEKKCSGVLVVVLVINKLLLHFDPTSGRDWAVPAHLTVFAVLTKGSLMDESIYPKPSLPHTSWIQTMLRSALLLSTDLVQLLLCSTQKGSAERPSSNKIFRFLFLKAPLFSYSTECEVRNSNVS